MHEILRQFAGKDVVLHLVDYEPLEVRGLPEVKDTDELLYLQKYHCPYALGQHIIEIEAITAVFEQKG